MFSAFQDAAAEQEICCGDLYGFRRCDPGTKSEKDCNYQCMVDCGNVGRCIVKRVRGLYLPFCHCCLDIPPSPKHWSPHFFRFI